jgi:FtsZ-interacting cell division protein ZipA
MEKQQQHPVHNERAPKQPTTSARSDSSVTRTPLLQHDEKEVHERIRQSLSSHSAVRAHSAHKKGSQQQRTRQERKRQASQQVQRSDETHDVSAEPLAERCANVNTAKPASHQHQSPDPQHVVAKETHEDCKRQIADAQTEVQNLRARLGASQDGKQLIIASRPYGIWS